MAEQCPQCQRSDATLKISDAARENSTFAAPVKPRLGSGSSVGCAVMVISTVLAVVAAAVGGYGTALVYGDYYREAAGLTPRETAANAAVLIFMIAFTICFFLGFFVYQRRALTGLRERIIAWQRATARWQRAHHCTHCDAVFIAGEGRALPSTQLADLLEASKDEAQRTNEGRAAVA